MPSKPSPATCTRACQSCAKNSCSALLATSNDVSSIYRDSDHVTLTAHIRTVVRHTGQAQEQAHHRLLQHARAVQSGVPALVQKRLFLRSVARGCSAQATSRTLRQFQLRRVSHIDRDGCGLARTGYARQCRARDSVRFPAQCHRLHSPHWPHSSRWQQRIRHCIYWSHGPVPRRTDQGTHSC
jgi:hypothetical protein